MPLALLSSLAWHDILVTLLRTGTQASGTAFFFQSVWLVRMHHSVTSDCVPFPSENVGSQVTLSSRAHKRRQIFPTAAMYYPCISHLVVFPIVSARPRYFSTRFNACHQKHDYLESTPFLSVGFLVLIVHGA